MPKIIGSLLGIFLTILSLSLTLTPPSFASHIPSPTGYVNDFANVLTADQKASIENSLQEYEQKTGNEIAIAIIQSLNGENIDDFTVKVFEEWKIGKKGKDNGILFLAAIDDRKMRIEVGYGLEPSLTDGEAGNIIRNTIAPEFKKEDYYTGIVKGVQEIQKELSGNNNNSSNVVDIVSNQLLSSIVFRLLAILLAVLSILLFIKIKPKKYAVLRYISFLAFAAFLSVGIYGEGIIAAFYYIGFLLAFFILLGVLTYMASFFARSKEVWAGGVVGAVLGGGGGLLFGSIGMGLLLLLIFGGLGLLLDYILSKNYRARKAAGKSTGWWGSGGGFFGGGSGGGGFGGGGSGGGGASGGW